MHLFNILILTILGLQSVVSFRFSSYSLQSHKISSTIRIRRLHQHIQTSFDEFLDSMDAPVLVDFYAEWCGPCRMMAPVLQDVASRFENIAKIAKIDTDKAPNIAVKYQVEALPTLILFYKGSIIDRYIGYRDADTLEKEMVQSLKKIGEFYPE